ncbi:MAG: hypothetical protein AAFR61_29500 [Bacteroidota bacterium]
MENLYPKGKWTRWALLTVAAGATLALGAVIYRYSSDGYLATSTLVFTILALIAAIPSFLHYQKQQKLSQEEA